MKHLHKFVKFALFLNISFDANVNRNLELAEFVLGAHVTFAFRCRHFRSVLTLLHSPSREYVHDL